jgi:type I restriction enzyme S subunit
MSQYKAYPAYKDSGVEWIGQVPEHWEVKPICRVTSVNDDALSDSTTGSTRISYVDISSVGYTEGIKQATEMAFEDAPSRARRKASTGDVVVSTVRTYLKAVAAVTDEYADCIFSTGFAVLRARQLEQSFLKWMILNELLIQSIEAHSEGLSYPAINASALVKLKSVIPPPEEQASIAAALDRETARIDALIQKKTRFIELLKEKRQALITHAVTKGLDPNVKMKDSGVEWIGKVPEHWDVKPFFALVTELNRKNVGLVETNILSLSYGNIIQKPETRNMGLTPESYETYQIVESGEIVFRFTDLQNDKRSLRSAQVTQRGIITSAYMAVKPHSIDSTYFAWLMRSYDLCKVFYAMGGGLRQSLKFEDVRRLPILIPPVDEQSEITNTINAETARIDALVEKTEQSITLLKERRSAFITAAVTGQIDLRGEQ